MKKHANLSIFVPHAGCKHLCSFCDQNIISAKEKPPQPLEVTALCEEFLPQNGENTEIAFFGGSFTAIEPVYREALLRAAYPFVQKGRAMGIRISTRPDAIDADILAQLKAYGVTAIELGAQSMDDEVLKLNRRGHTADDVRRASAEIKAAGFELGLQMMPGLYGEGNPRESAVDTMTKLLACAPATMRIYPAVTLEGTHLAQLYKEGLYTPLTIEKAADISAELLLMCEAADVRVIRMGLAADEGLKGKVLAGPYHPAFRQLCESEIFYSAIAKRLYALPKGQYNIYVAQNARSNAAGQKNTNISRFAKLGYKIGFKESIRLKARAFTIEEVKIWS
ncbi:MAG: radical SAM protein [Oscillospiraceae bacterium]